MRKRLWMRGMALLCSSALLLTGAVNVHAEAPSQETTELSEDVEAQGAAELSRAAAVTETAGADENYDITAPVIESISIDKQGQTVKNGDTVTISVQAYDTGVGIEKVEVTLGSEVYDYYTTVDCRYNDDTKIYEAVLKVSDYSVFQGKTYIDRVAVEDANGNYATGVVTADVGVSEENALYWVYAERNDTERNDTEAPVIESVELKQNGATVKPGDTLEFTVRATDNVALSANGCRIWCGLRKDVDNANSREDVYLSWNEDDQCYHGSLTITEKTYPGELWEVTSISVEDASGNETYIYDLAETVNLGFTVQNDDYDVEAPRVQNVSMDRAGEIINTGDSVKLTVEATDDREIERVSVCMEAAESEGKQQDIQLIRVEGTDRYEGNFKVLDNTYPCEWYIDHVYVYDKAGNYQYVNGYKDGSCTSVSRWEYVENAYLLEEKYYVNVMQGNTFVESTTFIYVTQTSHLNKCLCTLKIQ